MCGFHRHVGGSSNVLQVKGIQVFQQEDVLYSSGHLLLMIRNYGIIRKEEDVDGHGKAGFL